MTKPEGTRTDDDLSVRARPTPPAGVPGTASAPEDTTRRFDPARYRSRRQPSAGGYNAGLGADRPSRRGAQGEHGPLTAAGGGMAAGARVHRAGGGRLCGGERRGPGRWRCPSCASHVRPAHLQELLRGGDPDSGHRTGILWALAIGALLEDASRKLECFRGVGAPVLQGAADLIARGALTVEVERSKKELYVECTVERAGGVDAPCSSASTRASSAWSATASRCHWTSSPGRTRPPPPAAGPRRCRSRRRSTRRAPRTPPTARPCGAGRSTTWRSRSTGWTCPKASCFRSRPTG